ncbi:ComF family protein [Emticicia sp. 21SJ11W-3]|uniref:ComF family protein n=1 Tax=Emticicia sp. 21SJ11W-3 TaxID=2916755 RepID=UPI0020A104C1|nr:phosphoribosyltransferase family protein [Emticicia sp. 21SJ11W-3]UTA68208.1 ComF family protein [Emticicia sp. 21SJ11W-3]
MKWVNHLVDIIYPKTCESCGDTLLGGEKLICTKCLIDLPRTYTHLKPDVDIEKRFWGKLNVAFTISFVRFSKKGKVQRLLHQLKYKNKPELGVLLGELYGRDLKAAGFDKKIDLIIGVPMHKEKEKQRGYNQANCIAEGLSNALGVPYDTAVAKKLISTTTQTNKSRFERFTNAQNVFDIDDTEKIKGKRIAIVDDVLTTGATIESFGQSLLNGGCSEIAIITIAAAD